MDEQNNMHEDQQHQNDYQQNEYHQQHDYHDDGEHEKIDLDDITGKIFIGGLSWQTSEANLRYYFEKFGELSDVALMIDKRTGKPRYYSILLQVTIETDSFPDFQRIWFH